MNSIKNMSNSELSRRRLKVHKSAESNNGGEPAAEQEAEGANPEATASDSAN